MDEVLQPADTHIFFAMYIYIHSMQALIHVEYNETEHVLSVYFKQKKLINMKKNIYIYIYELLFSPGDDLLCWRRSSMLVHRGPATLLGMHLYTHVQCV